MEKEQSPVTFRANDEDRKIIAELIAWTGLAMSSIIRLALRRLHDEESKRRSARPSGAINTRKR